MANTLKDAPQDIAIAKVVHHGEQITLPEKMNLDEAIATLQRRQTYLEEDMQFSNVFAYFPYDGANAINEVLEKKFGWSLAEPTPGMFGPRPPQILSIEVAPKVFKKVPWGRFSVPGTEGGWIQCAAAWDGSSVKFALSGLAKRKYEGVFEEIFAETRAYLEANSIYRGKAVKIRFNDDDGNALDMPLPEFMDLTDVDENMLIYSDDVQTQITNNLLTPIVRVNDLIANGVPVKRGVMLAGKYGTGKTLGAKVAAKKAVQNDISFIYIPHADELAKAISFAKQYQSPACVVFCEDIDRALNGERTVEMDDILNIIDGIDTKTCNIITILTTNHIEAINPTMLRPGRLDAIIEVKAPDAKAVQKLLRAYGGSAIRPETNLDKAGDVLNGQIPATIAEVIKRAKLAELSRSPVGRVITDLSEEAILEAAESIRSHVELLEARSAEKAPKVPTLEQVIMNCVTAALTNNPSLVTQNIVVSVKE